MYSKDELLSALKNVPDPEMGISIVDLGLIYRIKSDKRVNIELTFDPPWTPEKMTEEGKVALGFF